MLGTVVACQAFGKKIVFLWIIRSDLKFTLKMKLPLLINRALHRKFVSKVLALVAVDLLYLAAFGENLPKNLFKDAARTFVSVVHRTKRE